jgi:hypothetical protein
MELKYDAIGSRSDDASKTMDCDDEWWKEHLALSGIFYIEVIYFVLLIFLEVSNIEYCVSELS